MIRAYKYRLYPTPKQAAAITKQFADCRWLYNSALEHRIRAYKGGKPVSYKDQANELTAIKEQFPQFKNIYSQVLQDVLKRLDKAFQNFFRRIKEKEKAGFPRFKSDRWFNSITYPQSGFALKGNRLCLSKIGDIRVKLHRQIPDGATIKTCTVIREGEHWYCTLSFDMLLTAKKKVVSNLVGIDVGLTSFAVLSNGDTISNPRYYRKAQDKLGLLQKRYSKSKSKALKRKIVRLHRKTANQRKDFLHKTSHALVKQYDLIAYEDLNIKTMSKRCEPVETETGFAPNGRSLKSGLNKSISDAAWGMFTAMLNYKAESAGSYCIAVNPRNTSQACSGCGTIVKKKLSDRVHICPVCNLSLHRDINAAKNILSGTVIGIKVPPLFLKPPS